LDGKRPAFAHVAGVSPISGIAQVQCKVEETLYLGRRPFRIDL
jgi:hypothetical protein